MRHAIRQGDIYWIEDDIPDGSEPGFTRPYVIVQSDFHNATRLRTVLACALTSNLRRGDLAGSVLLDAGEASLSQRSVVVTSQLATLDKGALGEYIGRLSQARVNQILQGLHELTFPRPATEKPDSEL